MTEQREVSKFGYVKGGVGCCLLRLKFLSDRVEPEVLGLNFTGKRDDTSG